LLEPYPEETQTILRYLISVLTIDVLEPAIAGALQSGQILYDYQLYQVIAWLLENCTSPPVELLDLVRVVSFARGPPRYVKTV